MDPTHRYIHEDSETIWFSFFMIFCDLLCNFKVWANLFVIGKKIIDKANQLWAEFGPLRPTERVASQPKKAWMAGCISKKLEGFFAKRIERGRWTAGWFRKKLRIFLQNFLTEEVGLQVDFYKVRGLFCKTAKQETLPRSRPGNWAGLVGKDYHFGKIIWTLAWVRMVRPLLLSCTSVLMIRMVRCTRWV